MKLSDYHRRDKTIISRITAAIYRLIADRGAPSNFDETWELALEVIPMIHAARHQHYQLSTRYIGDIARANGLTIAPAPQAPYSPNAAWKMLARALGWNPRKNPIPKNITDYDEATRRQLAEKVIPFPNNPTDPVVVDQVARRVSAGVARHVRAAGRDAVIRTAELNQVTPAKRVIVVEVDSEDEAKAARRESGQSGKVQKEQYVRPERSGGVELGWARVLTGAENCVFCAMLASRGPVYKELTVLTAGKDSEREGLSFHDNCDCKAVLVIKGRKWEGEEQFKKLQDMWDDARDNPTDEELEAEKLTTLDRFRGRYRKALKEDPQQFATFKPEGDQPSEPQKISADHGYAVDDGGAGLVGSVFEEPGPDGFKLPAIDGAPEVKLHSLYGRSPDEYPRLDAPETMAEAAKQTARINSAANCVRATAAAVMRMKGYDVYPYATLYSSTKEGLQILDALEMWETDDGPVAAVTTVSEHWEKAAAEMPDGSYGVFSFEMSELQQRHVILWAKRAGKMEFIDPQQGGELVHPDEFGVQPETSVVMARLDDATPVGLKATDVIQPFSSQEV